MGIPPETSARKGSATAKPTLTCATGATQTGQVYDVQIKAPGAASWSAFRTGVTQPSATFVPNAGHGAYEFRARLRSTGEEMTDWSPPVTYTAS